VAISPVVLRVAEDVASHAMSRVIETEDEEKTPLWRRFAMDGLSGLGLGVLVGLLTFGVVDLGLGHAIPGIGLLASSLAITLGLSVLVVTLAGTVVGRLAEHRAAAEKRISHLSVAVILMVVGVVSTVALLIIASVISSSISGA
jgi:hypothetical protein